MIYSEKKLFKEENYEHVKNLKEGFTFNMPNTGILKPESVNRYK